MEKNIDKDFPIISRFVDASVLSIRLDCPMSFLADSHSRGLFAGLSLEGGVIMARSDVNRKFYGRQVSVRYELLVRLAYV